MNSRLANWFTRPRTLESGTIDPVRRRVYILPTRHGFVFAAVLLMMLLGAINYNLSLGFVLTFLLVAMAFNGMLFTFRNLARLRVTGVRARSVFAGGDAHFTLYLANSADHARYAIGLSLDKSGETGAQLTDVAAHGGAHIGVTIHTERRGKLRPGRLTLFTRFPLGMYYAWSYVRPDICCIVYPRPALEGLPPPAEAAQGIGAAQGQGQEDFAGLRSYHVGDPPRHVAWKAAARGQGLYTKQFSGQAASEIWLSWDQLPPRTPVEEKLSRMTRWVLDADARRLNYGLRLPGATLAISSGDTHLERCLEALALYGLPNEDDHG